MLHDPATVAGKVHPARGLKEVEAESVAFIVADAHGMATGDYTFPYVTGWAGEDGAKAVRATASRVASAAQSIINASTATHGTGGRAPGVEVALQARHDTTRSETPAPELWYLEAHGIGGAA